MSGGMASVLIYAQIIFYIVNFAASKNESNILRLSKQHRHPAVDIKDYNATDYNEEEDERKENGPLIGFSKNNPELDWKNYLKTVPETEEELRNLDIDFMKEKLSKTANSIQWLADLYDPLKWSRVPGKLQGDCKRDMDLYLESLKQGKLWAAKSQNFWVASSSVCRLLLESRLKPVFKL
ncbi:hypothetical protein KM043_017086 [Ampulex compressa]|nr:hypothetical protein KM043_017086 [Ampulex compressa]